MKFMMIVTNPDGYQWFGGYYSAATEADAIARFRHFTGNTKPVEARFMLDLGWKK